MSISIFEACKKRKRKPKLFGLQTFGNPGYPITHSGPFRDSVQYFLQECAELEDYNVEGMPIWCTMLVHENRGFVFPLYAIEESVKNSMRPFCDHCRCAGWSHHFVSKRKYHLIIPVDDEWRNPLNEGVFDLETHLLHGLIHSNGFGHLICINGIEGGSKYLCGREIMDLWDRICTNLHARKISLEDVAKKQMMDLRLLYGVTYGNSWFGRWGYKFCHGSYGVNKHNYESAIDVLSSLELDKIIKDFAHTKQCRDVKQIIGCYRDLSKTQLITIRDILRFILSHKSRVLLQRKPVVTATVLLSPPKPSTRTSQQTKAVAKQRAVKCQRFSTVAANLDSRWSMRRLEYTANVIVDALKEKREQSGSSHCGMTRQEARDAARLHIGDTGLIDYVLKSMKNVIVGGYIVRRVVNLSTRLLEFSIQEVGKGVEVNEPEPKIVSQPLPISAITPGIDAYSDVAYLYTTVLLGYPESQVFELASQTILNSKHFVKEWPFKDLDDDLLRFICRVMPSLSILENEATSKFPPGEYIVVPLHATIGDLKEAVQSAMRDTYCVMEKLVVTDIEGMEGFEDREVLFGAVESGSELLLRGRGLDLCDEFKFEGGPDNWTVICKCGARDDDGERMVSCDICEMWQHTRCSGIGDDESVPPLFVCDGCCASLMPPSTQPFLELQYLEDSMFLPEYEPGMEFLY
ncbi:PHD finger protein MALE MEIOCYTE DEATH 1-like [Cornus florida]|uniref:PHD finger protein MALE MEIOCYTE DEATH 1-like n=1 Tax=Cornus florida TaxID=4283 RepID=UPI0028963EB1|nr:PHD finger protein MALE MEIOCYTE DEATH 1-like [Cornus florida]